MWEEEHREAFSQRFEEAFGPDARLAPQNLVDKRKLEVRTPDVKIQVDPQRGDLVETRIIDGVGYVLIRAEGGGGGQRRARALLPGGKLRSRRPFETKASGKRTREKPL